MTEVVVDRVSKFGIMVDGRWVNWSKGFKPLFVQKGDLFDVSLDSGGHISGATKLSSKVIVPLDAVSDRSREILKGQCLNYAFAWACALGWDLEKPELRKRIADVAVVLFAELQNAGYLRW